MGARTHSEPSPDLLHSVPVGCLRAHLSVRSSFRAFRGTPSRLYALPKMQALSAPIALHSSRRTYGARASRALRVGLPVSDPVPAVSSLFALAQARLAANNCRCPRSTQVPHPSRAAASRVPGRGVLVLAREGVSLVPTLPQPLRRRQRTLHRPESPSSRDLKLLAAQGGMTEQQAWEKRKEEAKEAGTSNGTGNWCA